MLVRQLFRNHPVWRRFGPDILATLVLAPAFPVWGVVESGGASAASAVRNIGEVVTDLI